MSAANSASQLSIYIGQSVGIVISVPSAALYVFECCVILRNWKHFNNSFYTIFLLSAFNCLFMNFVPSFLFGRLIRLGWINQFFLSSPWWVPRVLCFAMYYNYHCENFATLCTLLHRMSVILNPFGFEKQWRYLLPICAVGMYVGPLLFTYRLLLWPLMFSPNADNSVEIVLDNSALTEKPAVTNFMVMLTTSIGYLLVFGLLNLAILLLYKRHQAKFQLASNDKSSRLTAYSVGLFFAQLLLCLFWLLITIQVFDSFFADHFDLFLSNQYIWLNDIRTLVFPSFFLLWASRELQERIREHFPWLPFPKNTTTAVKAIKSSALAVDNTAVISPPAGAAVVVPAGPSGRQQRTIRVNSIVQVREAAPRMSAPTIRFAPAREQR